MFLGLIVTGIEKVAYDNGYVIDELMQSPSTITLADLTRLLPFLVDLQI